MALGNVRLSQQSGAELATLESNPRAAAACARCHGDESQPPLSNLVPVLHGQPADYLFASLKAYAEGKRRSGIMQPLAADLRPRICANSRNIMPGSPRRRKNQKPRIQSYGSGAENWPSKACQTPAFRLARFATTIGTANPRLAGQHAAYMAEQLRLRKAGFGPSTDGAAIMTPIAQQLSDKDIGDVANYFETLPAETP